MNSVRNHDRYDRKRRRMSLKLQAVRERAKRDPKVQFQSLAHHIDASLLTSVYGRLRKKAAVGVDGCTHEEYGTELESRIGDLHRRLRTKRYRHAPIKRVHIPKDRGATRPIGISTVEDKIVQGAIRDVLEAVYEPLFSDGSHGFRPGRSAHDALRSLDGVLWRGEGNWILEADIQSFFDSVDRTTLMKMLRERVVDTSLLRLIGKCLNVGVLDGAQYSTPDEGTVQGSSLSPLLGNIYLHYVLDLWFEKQVVPKLKGKAHLIRYADDFVLCFQREDDARRVMKAIGKRFERFGLTLHPDKTRLFPFKRPPRSQTKGKGQGTFDFLGFTVYWRRSLRNKWVPRFKTRKARKARAAMAIADWCRRHRHRPIREQHAMLSRKLHGHYNYFGVNGNQEALTALWLQARRIWFKWLNRRSQRASKTWAQFNDLLRDFPLPTARIKTQLWST